MQRTELDKELSRLQKNARNKLYRLRKRGASNAQINSIATPVKSAADVAAMSTLEKRKYLANLRKFNSRDTKYTFIGEAGAEHILQRGSTVAVPAQKLWEYRIAEAEANIARHKVREQLESVREQYLGAIEDFDELEEALAVEAYRTSERERFSDIREIVRTEPFTTIGNLEQAQASMERAPEQLNMKRNPQRYANWRESIVNRLNEHGYTLAAEEVKGLTVEQMDYLHYYTDWDELTEMFHYERDLISRGIVELSEEELDAIQAELVVLARRAKKIRAEYTI